MIFYLAEHADLLSFLRHWCVVEQTLCRHGWRHRAYRDVLAACLRNHTPVVPARNELILVRQVIKG